MRKNTYLTLTLFAFMLILLLFPSLCLQSAQKGLLLWFNKVLPSLLPFMILINILVPLDGLKNLINLSTPFTRKIWNLPGYSFFSFIMGLIASYPMGAKIVRQLYQTSKLSKEEAELTLCFSNNCGPLFIIGTIGTAMLARTSLGYYLFFIHLSSALTMSLLVTRTAPSSHCSSVPAANNTPCPSFSTLLNQGVMNAMDTIVCVGGYIILFSVLTTLLTETPLSHALINLVSNSPMVKSGFTSIIAGLLELSNGSYQFTLLPLSIYSLAAIASVIGFGGLCVYFQTLYVLEDSYLSTKPYLLSKCLQGGLSFGLCLIFYPFYLMYTRDTSIAFSSHIWLSGILIVCSVILLTLKIFPLSLPSHSLSDYVPSPAGKN